jgi:hypothetical protein
MAGRFRQARMQRMLARLSLMAGHSPQARMEWAQWFLQHENTLIV